MLPLRLAQDAASPGRFRSLLALQDEMPAGGAGTLQLVAALRPVLDSPKLSGRVEGNAMLIAMPGGPDLRQHALRLAEGIAPRRCASGREVNDFAERRRHILRLQSRPARGSVTDGDEESSVPRDGDPAALLRRLRDGCGHPEGRLESFGWPSIFGEGGKQRRATLSDFGSL
jgi:hypothetical protein